MASVNSPIRKYLKPLLFKLLGKNGYEYFQTYAKAKDIKQLLVEEAEMQLYPKILKRDSNCIDVGANYAYHTHRLAQLCPDGRIIAFEPIPFTYRVCKRLIRKFHLKNVELYQKGVGEKNGTVSFEMPMQDFGVLSAGQAHLSGRNNELEGKEQHYKFTKFEVVECEIVQLDSMDLKLNSLDLVKLDIEGAELFALKGMSALLQKFKPHIYIEINPFFLKGFGIAETELNEFFNTHGYLVYTYNPNSATLHKYELPYSEDNYLLIHKDRKEELPKELFHNE